MISILLIVIYALTSCVPDFVEQSDSIYWNMDSLIMDTVVAQCGSITNKTIRVYNIDNLNVENISIRSEKGENSPFMYNINGVSGYSYNSISLHGNDSLFVFVQLKKNKFEEDMSSEYVLKDKLYLISGDVTRELIVISTVINTDIKSGEIDNQLWKSDKNLFIDSDLIISKGSTLIIEEGVKVFLGDNVNIICEGRIEANGSYENPIVFRTYRHDWLTNRINYNMVPNQWGRIEFLGESSSALLNCCNIMNGEVGISLEDGAYASITNCRLRYNAKYNICSRASKIELQNCIVSNSEYQIFVENSDVILSYCTIANYNEWGDVGGKALSLKDQNKETSIYYSIIDGAMNDEVEGDNTLISVVNSIVKSEYFYFENPQFKLIKPYEYDFHLTKDSPCIDWCTGDECYIEKDINGITRIIPDIGALEFVIE